jgi:mRNA-degrading endonuclease RelE of RelBE toxin-antitoxin system
LRICRGGLISREIPLNGDDWDLEAKSTFKDDLRQHVGNDGNLRDRVENKIEKIQQRPRFVGSHKSYELHGRKVERVDPYIIVFQLDEDEQVVQLLRFLHHSDPRYAPEG